MAQNPVGLLFQIKADPSQAQSALESFRGKTVEQLESVRSEFAVVQQGQSEWSSSFLAQSSAVDGALLGLGRAAAVTFDQLTVGLAKNISTALIYSQSMSEALDRTLKSTTASIAAEAVVQGLRSTALGFYLLATGNVAGAGSAFESAAIWGSIGAVAAGVGAGISGPGMSGRAGASGTRPGYVPGYGGSGVAGVAASALASGAAPSAPAGNLTVAIMGDADAANWLATTLNTGVARGITLNATSVQKSPYAGG
ncbi:MAG TPA: hypothetical protein VMT20_19410 [Terriglobia bacterium]|nr:hypothetical protein [Terriglobia bacterium]